MYFYPPSYFLITEDILLKFSEIIENILVQVGLAEVCIFNKKAVLKQFFMLILESTKKMAEVIYV